MSLTNALNTAVSGLQTTQRALRITSNNVSNANTEGYTRKVADPITRIVAGEAEGVDLGPLRREIDAYLTREAQRAKGVLAGLEVKDDFYQRMQDLFGRPGDDSSLSAQLTDLATALQGLAGTPESPSRRDDVVAAAVAVAREFNRTSSDVQDLRLEADGQIAQTVDEINSLLGTIADLNDRIARTQAAGDTSPDLEDERDQALSRLRELIEVTTLQRSTGEVLVYTPDGKMLVDRTAQSLDFARAQNLAAGVSGNAVTVVGTPLSGLENSRLASLLELRDGILPDLQAELDTLAVRLRDEVNAIHNKGSGLPPAETLTGSRMFADPSAGVIDTAGTLRIALINADGTVAEAASVVDVDFDALADGASLQDVRDHINAAFAAAGSTLSPGGPASIVDGRLRLSAPSGTGVALVSKSPPAEANLSSSPGEVYGLSHFFGLNDLFVSGDTAAGQPATGVSAELTVRQDIVSDPSGLSRGTLSDAAGLVAGDPAIFAGDGTIARSLAEAFDATRSFAAAGALPALDATLAGYATEVLSDNAHAAARVEADMSFQKSLAQDLGFRAQSKSGVNIDEEMANLTVLQQAYSASARVISTVQEMFDVLAATAR